MLRPHIDLIGMRSPANAGLEYKSNKHSSAFVEFERTP